MISGGSKPSCKLILELGSLETRIVVSMAVCANTGTTVVIDRKNTRERLNRGVNKGAIIFLFVFRRLQPEG